MLGALLFCGMFWARFEAVSSKIQMIKNTNADKARQISPPLYFGIFSISMYN